MVHVWHPPVNPGTPPPKKKKTGCKNITCKIILPVLKKAYQGKKNPHLPSIENLKEQYSVFVGIINWVNYCTLQGDKFGTTRSLEC